MDADGNAAPAKLTLERIEASGNRVRAVRATPVASHMMLLDAVPVAHDERLMACRTIGRAPYAVVHVPGVDVMESFTERDFACA